MRFALRRLRQCRYLLSATLGVALAVLGDAGVAHGQEIQRGAAARREIRGTVLDSASQHPLVGASVSVVGTRQGGVTDDQGRYSIVGVLPAAVILTVRWIGYTPVTRRVDVSHGSAVADFVLSAQAALLGALKVTDRAATFLNEQQATSTMSSADVEKNRGQTLGETIKEMPGVSIIQYGPSIAKPVVRGLHQHVAQAQTPQIGAHAQRADAAQLEALALQTEVQLVQEGRGDDLA